MNKIGNVAVWVGAVAMALVFVPAGIAKLFGATAEEFIRFGYPMWFMYLTGVLEIVAGALLFVPKLRAPAALLLAAIMVGAAATHIAVGDPIGESIPPAVFMTINLALAVSTLRVRRPAVAL